MTSETVSGVGTLWDGEIAVINSVPYTITITTRDSGLGSIDGYINGDFVILTDIMLKDPPPALVLQLQDGRRWECFLANNDGRLVNRGSIR